MKRLATWAWLVVLGTALALSWWSLDALALRFGMPRLLAGMVSATFDGAALVAADLALRRAVVADPTMAVKLLMLVAAGLSTWLNYEHAALLGYPLVGRVLFAAPPVLSGWLFELQLHTLRRARLREIGRNAKPAPKFGMTVWFFHPWSALTHLSRIAKSRLRSVPVTVMDWEEAPAPGRELPDVPSTVVADPVILAAPVEGEIKGTGEAEAGEAIDTEVDREQEGDDLAAEELEAAEEAVRPKQKAGRSRVPDELYLVGFRELVAEAGGAVPSAREVARRLGVGQDRARRLIAKLKEAEGNAGAAET